MNCEADLIEPLVGVYCHSGPQRFGQNQDVPRYSSIRPGTETSKHSNLHQVHNTLQQQEIDMF